MAFVVAQFLKIAYLKVIKGVNFDNFSLFVSDRLNDLKPNCPKSLNKAI